MEILKTLCQLQQENRKSVSDRLQKIIEELSALREDFKDLVSDINTREVEDTEKRLNDEFLTGLAQTSD